MSRARWKSSGTPQHSTASKIGLSTLSIFSKIIEKLVYLQLNNYMQNKFLIYLTGFRKNHGTQHTLLKMIETWKTKLNMGHKVDVIYMDLSKAFESLNHDLLIAT